jgi:CRISPR/Cas system CMR subunit Cmr4 (Cas7 group RAMP superfamily)
MVAPDLAGAGGTRTLVARWVLTAELVLTSAAHFGGEGGDAIDMALLRDRRDGLPLLPGSSLAGALRAYLADRVSGYASTASPVGGTGTRPGKLEKRHRSGRV